MSQMDNARFARQFASYVVVGGLAALVEWVSYFVFDDFLSIGYLLATMLSFLLATFANYVLGRKLTFKNSQAAMSKTKEVSAVYLVSAVGLLLNIVLMFLFVQAIGLPGLLSKIIATGLVFFWNFLARKFWIYRI